MEARSPDPLGEERRIAERRIRRRFIGALLPALVLLALFSVGLAAYLSVR